MKMLKVCLILMFANTDWSLFHVMMQYDSCKKDFSVQYKLKSYINLYVGNVSDWLNYGGGHQKTVVAPVTGTVMRQDSLNILCVSNATIDWVRAQGRTELPVFTGSISDSCRQKYVSE